MIVANFQHSFYRTHPMATSLTHYKKGYKIGYALNRMNLSFLRNGYFANFKR